MESGVDHHHFEMLLLKLAEFGQFVSNAMRQDKEDDIISNPSVMVLTTLDLEGPQRPRSLQELTGLSSGGVTKVVDRLAERGFVRRRYGTIPDDHRGVMISITDDGRRRIRDMARALSEYLPESEVLVDELTRLLRG